MTRVFCFAVAFVLLMASFVLGQGRIRSNTSLITATNTDARVATDFHLILNGINQNDLDPTGFYGSDYTDRTVYTDAQGRVHIEWRLGTTPTRQTDKFGYTLRGGVQYTDCQWYWTYNNQPGDTQPDVFQDWVKIGTEIRDVVRYRSTAINPLPIYVKRTAGYSDIMAPDSFFDIFLESVTPPNPVFVDVGPTLMPPNTSLQYSWQLPNWDPWYFMYYDVSDPQGELAFFQNVAVAELPEPMTLGLVVIGAMIGLGRRRK